MCCCLDSSIKINRDLPFSVSECGGGGGGVCSPMDGGGDDDDDGTPSEEALSLSRSNNTVSRSMAFIMTTRTVEGSRRSRSNLKLKIMRRGRAGGGSLEGGRKGRGRNENEKVG